ncbi:MAG TPA: cation transporter [Anaerolineaceae bacterium]|nr:cation transporter [Anaerolineaceae bacterium]
MRKIVTQKFRVPDMECPNCAVYLEYLEDELPGIQFISASYQKLLLEVEYDADHVSMEEILAAAHEIGYHPEPVANR